MTVPTGRSLLFAMLAVLIWATVVPAGAADRRMPAREREFIDIFMEARSRYEAATTLDAKRDVRLDMQVRVARFMAQSQDAIDWIGTIHASHTTGDGDATIAVEIAPGITISTARNRVEDPGSITLIRRDSGLYDAVDRARIGSEIAFDATIIRFLVASDDVMVEQPHLFARFTALDR